MEHCKVFKCNKGCWDRHVGGLVPPQPQQVGNTMYVRLNRGSTTTGKRWFASLIGIVICSNPKRKKFQVPSSTISIVISFRTVFMEPFHHFATKKFTLKNWSYKISIHISTSVKSKDTQKITEKRISN